MRWIETTTKDNLGREHKVLTLDVPKPTQTGQERGREMKARGEKAELRSMADYYRSLEQG